MLNTKTLFALALGLTLSSGAFAYSLTASTSANAKADIDGGGEMSSTVYNLNFVTEHFAFALKHTAYDYSGMAYDPVDSLTFLRFDVRDEGKISGPVNYFAGLSYGIGFEDDVHLSDNYSIMPRAGIGYEFSKSIQGFIGAAANFNEADNKFLPIIGIKIGNDSDHGLSGSIAYPATRVNYRVNEMLAFEGSLLTVKELYQLSDDSKLYRKGYVMEESYGAALGVIFNPLKSLTIRAGLQSYFDREYTIYTDGGNEIASYDADPSIGGYLNFGLNF